MDLIDIAIIDYAEKSGVKFNEYKQISYTPFDPSLKRTEAIIETGENVSGLLKVPLR